MNTSLFGIHWIEAPDGFICPRCQSPLERSGGLTITGPYSGSVRCTKCEYQDSVMGFLGRSLIQVEPMPEGVELLYYTPGEVNEDPSV